MSGPEGAPAAARETPPVPILGREPAGQKILGASVVAMAIGAPNSFG